MGNRVKDKVAIVTGAGRGIGREVAIWLAKDGAKVVVNDLGGAVDGSGDSAAPADEVVSEIKALGGDAVASYDSVAEYDQASKIVNTAIENFGKVSSGSGLGASGQANYAAAKEGMVGFARAVSKELEPYNIMVNAVYPGGSTRMTDTVPQSTTELRVQQRATAGLAPQVDRSVLPPESGDPANNAPKVVFLSSEAADGITGQVIGTSGWALSLYSPRRVIKSIHKEGRWTLDELEQQIPSSLGNGLVNPAVPEMLELRKLLSRRP